jgi:hypothetical protein
MCDEVRDRVLPARIMGEISEEEKLFPNSIR